MFLESFFQRMKRGEFNNYPNLIPLHQGLAYTVKLPDMVTNLLIVPYEYTGLAYIEPSPNPGNTINIFPYYLGQVIEEFELSHGTDLHKPSTEEAVLEKLYKHAWELEKAMAARGGSFEDYMMKMKGLIDFLRYFNSAVKIGKIS
ncbi:hypothetical protein [Paenibacillus mucilaginosus]|nr:hypothetical protein [Paenibacillus mucilaginosus]AEI45927.1 hypothetical protein KNP414_07423 [Paenibacillus mucilaginosus KNP414]MCG7216789.1 hypothetical protein [Paenibacillus mucilaginosus]